VPLEDAVNLNPTVRWLLTALSAGVTTLGGLIAAGEITNLPEWVGITVAVVSSVLGVLTVVPPQSGGTQQGVLSPSLTEPPSKR
jgi:threonine/homoserine efflux transporter RhtA